MTEQIRVGQQWRGIGKRHQWDVEVTKVSANHVELTVVGSAPTKFMHRKHFLDTPQFVRLYELVKDTMPKFRKLPPEPEPIVMPTDTMRICIVCKQLKPLTEFGVLKRKGKEFIQKTCRRCESNNRSKGIQRAQMQGNGTPYHDSPIARDYTIGEAVVSVPVLELPDEQADTLPTPVVQAELPEQDLATQLMEIAAKVEALQNRGDLEPLLTAIKDMERNATVTPMGVVVMPDTVYAVVLELAYDLIGRSE